MKKYKSSAVHPVRAGLRDGPASLCSGSCGQDPVTNAAPKGRTQIPRQLRSFLTKPSSEKCWTAERPSEANHVKSWGNWRGIGTTGRDLGGARCPNRGGRPHGHKQDGHGNRFLSSAVGGFLDLGGQQVLLTGQGYLGYVTRKNHLPHLDRHRDHGHDDRCRKIRRKRQCHQGNRPVHEPPHRARRKVPVRNSVYRCGNYKRTIFAIGKSGKGIQIDGIRLQQEKKIRRAARSSLGGRGLNFLGVIHGQFMKRFLCTVLVCFLVLYAGQARRKLSAGPSRTVPLRPAARRSTPFRARRGSMPI